MSDSVTWVRVATYGDLADGEAKNVPARDDRTNALF